MPRSPSPSPTPSPAVSLPSQCHLRLFSPPRLNNTLSLLDSSSFKTSPTNLTHQAPPLFFNSYPTFQVSRQSVTYLAYLIVIVVFWRRLSLGSHQLAVSWRLLLLSRSPALHWSIEHSAPPHPGHSYHPALSLSPLETGWNVLIILISSNIINDPIILAHHHQGLQCPQRPRASARHERVM